jgi:acetoin utilization deacetylase AcuC-like enzyme
MTTVGFLDADTYITRHSFDVARYAAGAATAAVERALDGDHCFSLMRPPGHHAVYNRAMGFCLLNNCAIAVKKSLDSVDRIAIVDWDVHHGNGTQQAFYGTDRVLYCSVHQEHHFPYSGSINETGTGVGKGYTINAPLMPGSDIGDYALVFSEIFAPSISRFRPDIVIISAGQDILSDDPLGAMNILPQDFESLTRIVSGAAGTPLALVLEGGYGVSHGAAVRNIFSALRSDKEVSVPEMSHRSTQNRVALLKKVHHLA